MEILPMRDLIKDEYDNYYVVTRISDAEKKITLVNAYMELSFRRILFFNDNFKKEFKNYEGLYLGQQAMDILKYRINSLETGEVPGHIYSLNDVKKEYNKIEFVGLYEKNPSIQYKSY
ncbi:hypothetical protein [Inediibacterium massiliense]|uniref:hypothetical protein n=1 Tax=Inediibacterium massiliense TaxID=1658111 RepID=UPI0006B40D0A|nr:hypothetical protein [Inediibacterium massiliense]